MAFSLFIIKLSFASFDFQEYGVFEKIQLNIFVIHNTHKNGHLIPTLYRTFFQESAIKRPD